MTSPRPAAADVDGHDPHLRLPRPLRTARVAEAVFVVVTSYVAMSLPLGMTEAGQMIRARLVLEAMVALAVLLGLPRRPQASRVFAVILAAYVLLGCIPHLTHLVPAVAAQPGPFPLLSLTITLVACASQLVVLVACLMVREPLPST
jgi:hypothetical protein